MPDYVRFSFQCPTDSVAFQRAMRTAQRDPMAPVEAILKGSTGVALITRVSPDLHQAIADAVAAAIDATHINGNDPLTGENP